VAALVLALGRSGIYTGRSWNNLLIYCNNVLFIVKIYGCLPVAKSVLAVHWKCGGVRQLLEEEIPFRYRSRRTRRPAYRRMLHQRRTHGSLRLSGNRRAPSTSRALSLSQ